jgi:hypothetical protein
MIAQGIALSAKQAFLLGVHQPTDTYKLALYSSRATIGPELATYTENGEISGQGYQRGGYESERLSHRHGGQECVRHFR